MIRALFLLTVLVGSTAIAARAADGEKGWLITGSPEAPPFVLMHSFVSNPKDRGYFFDCSGKERVQVTQTGVTKLLAGEPLWMSLSIDDVPPNLIVASSAPNPAGGEDLTIWVKKTDAAFVGLPKAKLMSLFSTGHTIAVFLNDDDRVVIGDFVQRCLALDTR